MGIAELQDLRYPVGKFKEPEIYTEELLNKFISDIEETPDKLRKAVGGLNEEQLNTPYRPGGWTVRQAVHHIADSHINSYVRYKLTLTEDCPTVKDYEQQLWAELNDSSLTPISVSLELLNYLHKRWVVLLRSLNDDQFERKYIHPSRGLVNLKWTTALYAWHGKHHIAHITSLRERNGW